MKKDLGDHYSRRARGWGLLELFEVVKLLIKNPQFIKEIFTKKKK